MLKNYLRIILRIAAKNKIITAFNILGLAAGITSFILIAIYVKSEFSYDRSNRAPDNIYRIATQFSSQIESFNNAQTTPALIPSIANTFPKITAAARLFRYRSPSVIVDKTSNSNYVEPDFLWADADIFKIFTLQFISGNSATALANPASVVLSESTARKYFGDKSPIGKILNNVTFTTQFQVTGVFKDLPGNTHFKADFICSLNTLKNSWGEPIMHNWNNSFLYSYIRLSSPADAATTEQQLDKHLSEHLHLTQGNKMHVLLQPVTGIHLHSSLMNEISVNGNIMYVYILSLVAILILMVSCINFVNLGIARSEHRSKEIGVRKVLGSSKKSIFSLVIIENVMYGLLAFIIGMLFLVYFLPGIASYTGIRISLTNTNDLIPVFVGFACTLLIVFITSVYPSVFMAGLKAVEVLKGKTVKLGKGMNLWNGLIIFQMSVTVFLLTACIVLNGQLTFLRSKSLGYKTGHVVNITLLTDNSQKSYEVLKSRLLQNTAIESVSATSHLIGGPLYQSGYAITKPNGATEPYTWQLIHADRDYVKANDLGIIAGRDFSKSFTTDSTNFLVNEAACRAMGLSSPQKAIGLDVDRGNGKRGKIVGVIHDFHFKSLHYLVEPLIIHYEPGTFRFLTVSIKNNASLQPTLDFIKSEWNNYEPSAPFIYTFPDQFTANVYAFEKNLRWMITTFTVIAILLSIGGLIGLNYYITYLKAREIGIRKVLGASAIGIVQLLSSGFIKLSAIAMLIAFPLAWMATHTWLQSFAYRISLSWWIFLVAGIVTIVIVIATVSYQSIKAALVNPIKSLKTE
ncbi:MAG: FtsX-like permease family protein [Chitinophagaceae bacterium]|nr:FtsX-like permease family protein [Chitinophagaceae bacterium]